MSVELKKAIDQISKDRGIDRDLLIDTLEEAVRSSVNKKFNHSLDVEVNFNEDSGEIDVYQFKTVVEKVDDPGTEITLDEARKVDPNVQMEDELGFRLHVEDLGRIAAQSAKQVIIQRMRDAEQEIIYEEYKDRRGDIISGIIQRRDRSGWIINLGRTEALLPKEEQIPRERFRRGDRVQGYIIDIKKEGRGPQIIVSRSHPDYMAALFRREVPEVADGTVKIMGVARDPGKRAKVAVLSQDSDVDPVGACVGVRGSRIHNVVQEFRGERIDIVLWSPDVATYAVNALSPARISRITVDEDENTLEVIVPDDQLTLAIGRKGQNVKLAAKLLGWKIDILTESRYGEAHQDLQILEQLGNVTGINADRFYESGFGSLEQIRQATDEELLSIEGLTPEKIADLRVGLNLLDTSPKEQEAEEEESDSGEEDAVVPEEESAGMSQETPEEAAQAADDAGEQKNASEEPEGRSE
ncbi:MAG: transcription termination factor NusA [Desulfohalobiaceae bacterium]